LFRSEAWRAHVVPDLGVGRVVGHGDAAFGGLAQDALAVEAAAVVADLDDDVRALVGGAQAQRAGFVLACGTTLVGPFQAGVDGVAHPVHQRVGDLLGHALVQFGGLAVGAPPRLLAPARGGVAGPARDGAGGADREG